MEKSLDVPPSSNPANALLAHIMQSVLCTDADSNAVLVLCRERETERDFRYTRALYVSHTPLLAGGGVDFGDRSSYGTRYDLALCSGVLRSTLPSSCRKFGRFSQVHTCTVEAYVEERIRDPQVQRALR
jgi:hypothetical protein